MEKGGEHKKMIILDIYEVAKLFVARGLHQLHIVSKTTCRNVCLSVTKTSSSHFCSHFVCSVVDKSGKLLAGPLPTAEENISEFFKIFCENILGPCSSRCAHNFYPIEIQRIISPPLSDNRNVLILLSFSPKSSCPIKLCCLPPRGGIHVYFPCI